MNGFLPNAAWVQEDLRSREPQCQCQEWGYGIQKTNRMTVHHTDGTNNQEHLLDILSFIKLCARQQDLYKGSSVHTEILKQGLLEKDIYVGNTLLHMYAKCGALTKAQELFDQLPIQDIVTWNALIAGYVQHGYNNKALSCFAWMQEKGPSPNAVTFTCILKVCSRVKAGEKGEAIHAEVAKRGLLKGDIILGNALVDMYAKCGLVGKAQELFDSLQQRDVISWSVLIAAYTQNGHNDEALNFFAKMQDEGLPPNACIFACVLKACGSLGAAGKGKEIHAEIIRLELMENDPVLGTALVDMYAKCGALAKAHEVFNELQVHDTVAWGALIAGYAQHGHGHEALYCFERMQDEGLYPSLVTFICVLKACGIIAATEKGKEIHAEAFKQGLLESSVQLGNTLVHMYARCGELAKAQKVFDALHVWDVVSWSVLIDGYVQNGHSNEALKLFGQMLDEGLSPNATTFVCILNVCGVTGAISKGKEIHAEIVRQGLLETSIVLGNALVDMYAKCGELSKAQEAFDELLVQDVVSWNAIIVGYSQHGHDMEALSCFVQMEYQGFTADTITYSCILKACGSIGAAEMGNKIHKEVVRQGLLENNTVLGTALVDIYAKCGALVKAHEVFDEFSRLDVATWNALIAGYAHLGEVKPTFDLLNSMIENGIGPDMITFGIVLTACSHTGLLDEGQIFFEFMNAVHNIIPTVEHHTSMIDLFTRAGHFCKAINLFDEVSASYYHPMWIVLLGACQKWINMDVARWAFMLSIQLDEKHPAAYVCMSNLFSAVEMQETAEKIWMKAEKLR